MLRGPGAPEHGAISMKPSLRTIIASALSLGALCAIAAWPNYANRSADAAHAAALPTMAPVVADYQQRDKLIAFWEGLENKHNPQDMLSPRKLAEEYLQRYRERGDIDDVLRAQKSALLSLKAQPHGNLSGELQLASIYLTLHKFREALAVTHHIESFDPSDDRMFAREASLDMEIGAYDLARRRLDSVKLADRDDGWRVVESRYLELTGHLTAARELLATASANENATIDNPAQQRAWYFFRQGEMAFEAGDNDKAITDERQAIALFPNYADGYRLLARFECALHRWTECLADATTSANLVPFPETLGYEADAQRALGDAPGAARTDGLIATIEKIGNTQHISDRLLAIYYSEHRMRAADAYAIAKRELKVRDDIFTEDTLAWAAAMAGRWNEARTASAKALRFDTENSLLQYHGGIIELHFSEREQAKRRFEKAVALNASFHPAYADDARSQLAAPQR